MHAVTEHAAGCAKGSATRSATGDRPPIVRCRRIHAIDIQRIAAAADCGGATVHEYLPTKQSIVVALLQPHLDRIAVRAQCINDSPVRDPAEAMRKMGTKFLFGWQEFGSG